MTRTLLLMAVAAAGTILLVRFAPGFFSDPREMDAKYAAAARAEMWADSSQRSIASIAVQTVSGWRRGDFGESRQFGVPVSELVRARIRVSALLLAEGLGAGWLFALCAAVPVSAMRRGQALCGLPFTILLAIPTAAMATACILSEQGGPVLVFSLVIAAREFKFLRALLESAWSAPHVLWGRAQGMPVLTLMRFHIVPNAAPRLFPLVTLSIVTALGVLVPIEVMFTVPGIGQLAWAALMNRDLPVLVATSLLMASAVGVAGVFSTGARALEDA
jgi:peptide/nickel transport system permease protein